MNILRSLVGKVIRPLLSALGGKRRGGYIREVSYSMDWRRDPRQPRLAEAVVRVENRRY